MDDERVAALWQMLVNATNDIALMANRSPSTTWQPPRIKPCGGFFLGTSKLTASYCAAARRSFSRLSEFLPAYAERQTPLYYPCGIKGQK